MPKILIGTSVILFALAGYAGYHVWQNQFGPPSEAEIAAEEAAEEAADAAAAEQWHTYTDNQFPFRFSYPPEASTTIENERAKVTFLGPDNTMGSEITDGFTVFVGTHMMGTGDTTETVANDWLEEETELGVVAEEVESVERGGRVGHSFVVETALGSLVRHYVLETAEPFSLTFSESVIDPHERAYDALIDHILVSIELE